jgi:hypothetical protein
VIAEVSLRYPVPCQVLGDTSAGNLCERSPSTLERSDSDFLPGADKDVAVLYRTKKTGRLFQSELRRLGVPFNVHGVSFWRRKVIRD